MTAPNVLRVAVPCPLRRWFEYLPPPAGKSDDDKDESRPGALAPGARVKVPFGRSTRTGVILETAPEATIEMERLRAATQLLDEEPALPPPLLRLLRWAADYYQHPVGEVVQAALPPGLRRTRPAPARDAADDAWRLTSAGASRSGNARPAPRQAAVLAALEEAARGAANGASDGAREHLDATALRAVLKDWRPVVRALERKGWVERIEPDATAPADITAAANLPTPNPSQQLAIDAIVEAAGAFRAFLLDGVTGSGKTEVYLSVIDRLLRAMPGNENGGDEGAAQALVLVPEIGLTPQLVARFRDALPVPVAVMHSGMTSAERLRNWQAMRSGAARILIGTRSAIFTPLARPAILIVDEEHDSSYKQQDGFRYSARDLALMRGSLEGCPVVLGSATPSLEAQHLVATGRCHRLKLAERAAAGATLPSASLHDVRARRLTAGLSERLLAAIEERLGRHEQTLLFINRRGFAPAVLCHDCGAALDCEHCDARLVLHRAERRLRCHHCGARKPLPRRCAECDSPNLVAVGSGTQRLAETLAEQFPDARIVRVDRDSTRGRGHFAGIVERARSGEADILVGTQMLAKGHDFPRVTLVGVVDTDGGLFSPDFRGPERMAQLLTQVAGRAGRGELAGEVIVQTRHPEHPLLTTLLRDGYGAFAEQALAERVRSGLPPFARLALLRADAANLATSLDFLAAARRWAEEIPSDDVEVLGPVPAPMQRVGGRHRAQLLLRSASRAALHRLLRAWVERLEAARHPRTLRWALDVDPVEIG